MLDQALYILSNDFFDKGSPINYDDISERIEDLTNTERIIIVYDPFCGSIFQELASKHQEQELRQIIVSYYGYLEECDKNKMEWYQLNEFLDYHMTVLNDIMISIDFMKYSISSLGALPMTIAGQKLFLYYHISPYLEVKDKFYLINEKDYINAVGDLWNSEEKS